MSDEHDFTIEAGERHRAADGAAEPAVAGSVSEPESESVPALVHSPKVVIEYRGRGLHTALLPPLLILIAALVITVYRPQTVLRPPMRPAVPHDPGTPATPAGQGRLILVEGSGTGAGVEPIVVRTATPPLAAESQPAPAPVTSAPAESQFEADPTPPVPVPVAGVGVGVGIEAPPARTDGPAERALEPPMPLVSTVGERLPADSPEWAFRVDSATEPGVTAEQILQNIQAESEQKQAEQKDREREVAQSKSRELWESIQKTQAERIQFHDDLRRLLRERDNKAGPEIKALCDRYGREVHTDIKKAMTLALNRSAAKANRAVQIALLRVNGVPEAAILERLANELDATRNSRGGPRDRNEVRVRAAQLLLRYRPSAPQTEKPAAATARTTAARAPAAGVPRPVARPTQ
jgi:hypothetical protein